MKGVFEMGLFEDAIVKAKDVFDIAAKKTGEVVSVQKLKIKKSQVNSLLNKDFETLGRVYFEQNSHTKDDKYKLIIDSIKEKLDEISEIEQQIDEQNKIKVCDECGCKNPEDSVFCNKCGTQL